MTHGITNDELRTLRHQAGLSQADLAERLGVRCCTVSRWEQGVRMPRGMMVAEIVATLNAEIAERTRA